MAINQLHPVYHSHSFQQGSRIDVEALLPPDLDDVDLDEFIDQLSEPPKYVERIAPVSTVIGEDIVRGRNYTEMMMKCYRVFLRLYSSVAFYIRQSLLEKYGERNMVPFMSIEISPETLHRMIELDYEQGENTYNGFMELFRNGMAAPCVTVPFNAILPLLDSEFDQRLCVRSGFLIYWKLLEIYHEFVEQAHGDTQFIVPFWVPECGLSTEVIKIIQEEMVAKAKAEKVKKPHLLLLVDNVQAIDCDLDVLMKSWDQMKLPGGEIVSLVFRDKSFSEWVVYSNPSVKKLIDRTIAKVDSELNDAGVDYCWSHFEDVESLTFSPRSASNFEQKIVKLAQLSYLAVSPDFFIRWKHSGRFGKAKHEPQNIKLKENTAWSDWHTNISLGRWQGVLDSNATIQLVDENRPYVKRTRSGKVQETGPQCWKIPFCAMRKVCVTELRGDAKTMKGGFLGVLADICGSKDPKIVARNVADFLVHYTLVHFREHFIQHDHSEADAHLTEVVKDHLLRDCRKRPKDEEVVIAGVAAQGYYHMLYSERSQATHWENMDQRAVFQSVVLLTLAFRNLIYIHQWQKRPAEVRKLVDLMKTEMFDFKAGFTRYRLADYGVTKQEWDDALKSALDDVPMNVVERAARRTAARHLRPLGLRKDFSADDAAITSNVGHIWSVEVENSNYKWENKLFCGMREE